MFPFFLLLCTSVILSHVNKVNLNQTGLKLVFDLAALYERANGSVPWNSSNTEMLLRYTAENQLPVYAFELGN